MSVVVSSFVQLLLRSLMMMALVDNKDDAKKGKQKADGLSNSNKSVLSLF